MTTTADRLQLTYQTKQNIKQTLEDRGVDVGDVPFSQYPSMINQIIASSIGGNQPVGTIVSNKMNINAEGWLPCDGRLISQVEYPELYGVLKPLGDDIIMYDVPIPASPITLSKVNPESFPEAFESVPLTHMGMSDSGRYTTWRINASDNDRLVYLVDHQNNTIRAIPTNSDFFSGGAGRAYPCDITNKIYGSISANSIRTRLMTVSFDGTDQGRYIDVIHNLSGSNWSTNDNILVGTNPLRIIGRHESYSSGTRSYFDFCVTDGRNSMKISYTDSSYWPGEFFGHSEVHDCFSIRLRRKQTSAPITYGTVADNYVNIIGEGSPFIKNFLINDNGLSVLTDTRCGTYTVFHDVVDDGLSILNNSTGFFSEKIFSKMRLGKFTHISNARTPNDHSIYIGSTNISFLLNCKSGSILPIHNHVIGSGLNSKVNLNMIRLEENYSIVAGVMSYNKIATKVPTGFVMLPNLRPVNHNGVPIQPMIKATGSNAGDLIP